MIAETKPDCVIVTTIDAMHDKYICRAMELGCDVITEKPMTMDEARCRRILDTRRKTGRKCTVTFNYRYAPARTQVKDLLMSGVIGNVLGVDFHWMLDVHHGADYFRRWHRNKTSSGGLLVHKATHHFDLVNWWLSDIPETVSATGRRAFYTPETAKRYGLGKRGKRCLDCPEAARCRFRLNLRDGGELQRIYLSNESHDGSIPGELVKAGSSVRIFPHWGNPFAPALWTAKGGHGGADPVMLDYIFSPGKQEPDKYLRAADQRSGAYSILCGVAAKKSILERRPVCIDELAQNIGMPDYAPMPAPADPLPMPPHEKKQKKIP